MRGVPGLGSPRGGSGRAPLAAEGRGFRVQEWRWLRGRFPTKGTFLELRDPLTRSRRGARSAEPLGARREPRVALHNPRGYCESSRKSFLQSEGQ